MDQGVQAVRPRPRDRRAQPVRQPAGAHVGPGGCLAGASRRLRQGQLWRRPPGPSARQIYYAIRPRVLELTGKPTLGDGYFSAQLLPEFLQDHPAAAGWRILFDPRGTLTEPHTGRAVPLGTAAVATYHRSWTNGIDRGRGLYPAAVVG